MKGRTALGEQILAHWREHRPRMVSDLERTGLLEEAIAETQARTGDLMYELVSVKKMDHQAAWELAMQEWAIPEEEPSPPASKSKRPPKGRRGTSG
jgi:hypothetical protein